ncbi:MAG: hypothetical protein QG574_5239 [Cyanobacteriota bacterium erpe_2018_sw_21hr_WHONDRS-SW48-000092_B_bin.40]|nr:hypothetical protein [Cyanobacteriota bacterium erpe_2018_sw_21hr_WHONDRS-SW48-000092_B_bin.40]
MTNDLNTLTSNGISLLRLDAFDWQKLMESRHRGQRFSLVFQHEVARSAKKNSVVIITINEAEENDEAFTEARLAIGYVRSVQAIATFSSRVSFDRVALLNPSSLESLLSMVSASALKAGVTRFSASTNEFEKVSKKLGSKLMEILLQLPENQSALQQISWQLNIPKQNSSARALQNDAVSVALKAFGATDTDAVELKLSESETALAGVRLQEDGVIEHDAREIEGWNIEQSKPTGWARFIRNYGMESLEIYTANKRPLEELLGVDLIYLNRKRGSLILVQYKMMEASEKNYAEPHKEKEWTVRIDSQFKLEMEKMTLFDKDLESKGTYRLNPSAFFFKLVKRNSDAKSAGLILSREHLQTLIDKGSLQGPKDGLRISYNDLDGHYIRSSGFIELIRSGYIGSRGATTQHLEQLINTALSQGRAIVGAIQSVLPERHIRWKPDYDFEALKPFEINEDMFDSEI